MNTANKSVTTFATIIGQAPIRMPYMSHRSTPALKIAYMPIEMPSVLRVFLARCACGTKAQVVSIAAG
jgi:hypothetical protein